MLTLGEITPNCLFLEGEILATKMLSTWLIDLVILGKENYFMMIPDSIFANLLL